MYTIFFISVLIGTSLGFLYGNFFLKRLKKLYFNPESSLTQDSNGELQKAQIFRFSFFYILTFILLSSVFVLFVFRFKLNLLALSISFLLFFWIMILKGLNIRSNLQSRR